MYSIFKNDIHKIISFDVECSGYFFKPLNSSKYIGTSIKSVIVVKKTLIEKILKRKIRTRLDKYLDYFLDTEDEGGKREALDNLSRYKHLINEKYNKYLNNKYLLLLNNKIDLLEQRFYVEPIKPSLYEEQYEETYEEEIRRSR